MSERKPVEVHCGDCGHAWPAAYVPMPMAEFANLLSWAAKAGCPMCTSRKIFMGPRPTTPDSEGSPHG